MKKKLFALMLTLCLVLGMTSVVFAADGTQADPYMFAYMGEAVEITIPAGTEQYYIYKNNLIGETLSVSGSWDVQVFYGVQTFFPSMIGTIEFTLVAEGPMFKLYNPSESDITVTIDLVQKVEGTPESPIEIMEAGWFSAEITPEREGMPVYYRYVAPADGTVWVAVTDQYDEETWEVIGGWVYAVNNLSSYSYGDTHYSDEEEAVYEEELEVKEGDVIEFFVGTYDPANPYSCPEGKVDFSVYFEGVPGGESNPIYLDTQSTDTTIPTGDALYYMAYGLGGTTLEINGDVYVIYNGEKYEAVGGVVSVPIEAGMYPMMPTYLQIGTDSEEEVAITFNVSYPEGDYMNPADLEEGDQTVEIEEGGSEYYYTWTAPADGKLTLVFSSEGGWMYTVNNITAETYGDTQWSDSDPVVNTVTIEVAEGDEIQIIVCSYDAENPWAVPAGAVKVNAAFAVNEIKDNGDATANMIAMIVLLGGALLVTGFVAKKRAF